MFDYIGTTFLIPFLSFCYETIYPNYGIAIILMTLLIKVAFYPLTRKQFESMKATQKMQPRIKEIQEKHKKDPKKMQQEMMKIWKETGTNPLSGCLPAIVQFPVFIAVFITVNGSTFKQMLAQPGINPGLTSTWLSNLAMHDTTYILPIIIGLAMFWSQKMTVMDPKQQQIMMFMPFIMAFFSLKMPGGVLLYWATSTIVGNIQQYYILKEPKQTIIDPAK